LVAVAATKFAKLLQNGCGATPMIFVQRGTAFAKADYQLRALGTIRATSS
jgi:hypothetical protein